MSKCPQFGYKCPRFEYKKPFPLVQNITRSSVHQTHQRVPLNLRMILILASAPASPNDVALAPPTPRNPLYYKEKSTIPDAPAPLSYPALLLPEFENDSHFVPKNDTHGWV